MLEYGWSLPGSSAIEVDAVPIIGYCIGGQRGLRIGVVPQTCEDATERAIGNRIGIMRGKAQFGSGCPQDCAAGFSIGIWYSVAESLGG